MPLGLSSRKMTLPPFCARFLRVAASLTLLLLVLGADAHAAGNPGSPGTVFRECGNCPEMVVIPSGHFTMGSTSAEQVSNAEVEPSSKKMVGWEGPRHEVAIKSFGLALYDVTFSQWNACVNEGGCGGYRPDDNGWGQGNRPVINVSWDDAKLYVDWLNSKVHRLQSDENAYRLPSEAEWEYAARGGTVGQYWWGDKDAKVLGNYVGYGGQDSTHRTTPVGSFRGNPFGVFDITGNVFQWLEDCWHSNYDGAPTDGSPWLTAGCQQRSLRGGSAASLAATLRSAARWWLVHSERSSTVGFRVARTLTPSGGEVPGLRLAQSNPSQLPSMPVLVPGRLERATCPEPAFPAGAKQKGEQGTVTMKFQVGPSGKASGSELVQSSGFADLDQAAISAFSQCSYRPETLNGRPVMAWVEVKYTWSLSQ